MVALLVGLGIGLVVVGVVVLLRFPDRPGGVVRLRGLEVGSKGAGLPLIVVGAVLATVAVVIGGAREPHSVAPSTDSPGSGGSPEVRGLDAPPRSDCTDGFFVREPQVEPARIRSAELDAVDRRVLGTGERQDLEFGLVFSDTLSSTTPVVLGAMKLAWRSGTGFRVSGVIDEQGCREVGVALDSSPGVPAPAALGDYVWVTFRLGDEPYVLLLNSSNANTEVLVTLHRKA
jgi:hypothetical protein